MTLSDNPTLEQVERQLKRYESASNARLADELLVLMQRKELYADCPLILEVVDRLRKETTWQERRSNDRPDHGA